MRSKNMVCGECQKRGNEQQLTGAEQPVIKETIGFGRGSSGKWTQQFLPAASRMGRQTTNSVNSAQLCWR